MLDLRCSKTKFEKQTLLVQNCGELLSSLRESSDYARANVWHGYQYLRHLISWKNTGNPTKLNIEADGSIECTGTQHALEEAHSKIPYKASFKFTNNPRIQGPSGAIAMVLSDSFEQRV